MLTICDFSLHYEGEERRGYIQYIQSLSLYFDIFSEGSCRAEQRSKGERAPFMLIKH